MRFRLVTAFVLGSAGLVASTAANAQNRTRAELRLDAVAARVSSLQAGIGLTVRAGTYARFAFIGAAGGTTTTPSRLIGRVEAIARFVLDPFAESRYGLYGFGGLSAPFEANERDPRLVVGVGVEGPIRRRTAIAAEVGLGGGMRIGLVLRGASRGRR